MSLEIRNLTLGFPGGVEILRGIDLVLKPGARIAIIGANGSGKSLLAACLAGLQRHAGDVLWQGRPWNQYSRGARAAAVQLVGQRPDLQLSGRAEEVRGEVAFGPGNLARPHAELIHDTDAALALMGLGALSARDQRRLSGGESQRLSIASAMAMRPGLLILDEPVTDLDQQSRDAFARHVAALGAQTTLIALDVVLRPWMADLCDELWRLEDGMLHGPLSMQGDSTPVGVTAAVAGDAPPQLSLHQLAIARDPARPLIDPCDITLPAGAVIAVSGPNGAGKTSLMRAIAGLDAPAAGTIRLAGMTPRDVPAMDLARALGMVFQNSDRQFLTSRVRDEIAFTSRHLQLGDHEARALRILDEIGLADIADSHPFDLDNGTRRLVAVASAIAHGPAVVLLDECQRGLDAGHTAQLEAVLTRLRASGTTVLLVCHDADFAQRNATHVLELRDRQLQLRPASDRKETTVNGQHLTGDP